MKKGSKAYSATPSVKKRLQREKEIRRVHGQMDRAKAEERRIMAPLNRGLVTEWQAEPRTPNRDRARAVADRVERTAQQLVRRK